ncbi:putative virion structural protein [Salmonella phage SPFM12]|nr:putative virion structural protein [Salmonella phage SPFM12]
MPGANTAFAKVVSVIWVAEDTPSPYNLRGATVVFVGIEVDDTALAIELNKCVPEYIYSRDIDCSHISRFLSLLANTELSGLLYPDHQDIQLGQAWRSQAVIELKPATPLAEVVTEDNPIDGQTHTVVAVETSHEHDLLAAINERFNLSILPEDIPLEDYLKGDVAFGDEDVQTTLTSKMRGDEGTQVIVDYHRRDVDIGLPEVVSVDGRDSEVVQNLLKLINEENKISPPLTFDKSYDLNNPLTRVNAMSFTSKFALVRILVRTTLLICWQGV